MHSKSMILPALLGLGAVAGLTFLHFGRSSSGAAGEARRSIDTTSSIASDAPPSRSAAADSAPEIAQRSPFTTATTERRAVAQRQPESDADPADVPTAPADFPTYDQSAVQLTEEHQVPAEKSGAADANVRAAVIREIDTGSPDSFPLLEQTLRSDPSARNRILAVSSLRLLGKQAGNAERARAALRLAMSDADQNVSTNARDAYDELAR